ncbi:response regulator [Nocardia sp. NPDC004722]
MGASLMIIDDDDRVRSVLRLAMEGEGYEVAEAREAEEALANLSAHGAPDFMIVDLMLGGMDGFTCIREIRRHFDVPIIVVSARDDSHDVVAALEAGADDYVTKPFQVKEITARMRALRRRMQRMGLSAASASGSMFRAADDVVLEPDPVRPLLFSAERATVRRGGELLHLTDTEFRLLSELAAVPGNVLTRRTLLERVWDQGFFGDERVVDVHIRRLRTKIERDPSNPRIVVTVRYRGYRIEVAH